MDRREFIKGVGLATGGAVISPKDILAKPQKTQEKTSGQERVDREKDRADLESVLNRAFDDKPFKLKIGDDFEAPEGSVIFASRDEGIKRMVKLAREGKPELSILHLPLWEAWITITKSREVYNVKFDDRYVEAALMTQREIELWHIHNDKSTEVLNDEKQDEKQKNEQEEKHKKLSLVWTMPSVVDFQQLFVYADKVPDTKLVGAVASTYGITTYWTDEPNFGRATYHNLSVMNEAEQLRLKVEKASLDELPEIASSQKGFIKLKFEP